MWLIRHLAQFLKKLNCQIYFDSFKNEIDKIVCYVTIFIFRINTYGSMFQGEFIRLQLLCGR